MQQSEKQPPDRVFSIIDINQHVATLLKKEEMEHIKGEAFNIKQSHAGHVYFKLKDEYAEISCAIFLPQKEEIGFMPTEGDVIEAYGYVDFYRKTGELRFRIENLRRVTSNMSRADSEAPKVVLPPPLPSKLSHSQQRTGSLGRWLLVILVFLVIVAILKAIF